MGGKSPGQPGAYDDPNPQPFMNNMRELMKGAMTNLGPGFWGPQGMPNFGGTPAAAAAPATPAAMPAAAALDGNDLAAPARPAANGSSTTTPDSSAGTTLASAVINNNQPTPKKTADSAVVTQT